MADTKGGPRARIRLARTPVPVIREGPPPEPVEGEEAPEEIQWAYATPPTIKGVINIGTYSVNVPDEETQRAGFDLPRADARRLLAQFPDIYKRELTKGASQQAQPQQGQQQTGVVLDPEATADRTQDALHEAISEEEGQEDAEKD